MREDVAMTTRSHCAYMILLQGMHSRKYIYDVADLKVTPCAVAARDAQHNLK